MKRSSFFAMLAFFFSLSLYAAVDPLELTASSMVPKGEVIRKSAREYTVKSSSGTKIKLEFERTKRKFRIHLSFYLS